MKWMWFVFAAGWVATAWGAPARGANWATDVVQYSAGATYPSPDPTDYSFVPPAGAVDQAYTTASAGILDGITADTGYGVLTPFNAAYSPGQYLGLGAGGTITLEFAAPVRTNGYTIGVHTASGLIDFDYPNGYAGTTATLYTTPRSATVAVSADNVNWFTLGTFDLDNPSNYYATGVDTPGYQPSVTGGTVADVEQPFLGEVSSFDGESWTDILATLNGSAGGNWLDLSASGLPSVSYIQFTVPAGSILYLDGVVGLPVPEPATLGALAPGLLGLAFRRRRGRTSR